MKSALARELRENSGYLRDRGWDATARLMEAAAAELDRLSKRVAELERREDETASRNTPVSAIIRRFGR